MSRKIETTRNHTCTECGGNIHEKRLNDDFEPIWKCANCPKETPRQTRVSAKQKRVENTMQSLLDGTF